MIRTDKFLIADNRQYCNDFDLRKPLDRQLLGARHVHCISIQDSPNLATFRDQCATFLAQLPRFGYIICCFGMKI